MMWIGLIGYFVCSFDVSMLFVWSDLKQAAVPSASRVAQEVVIPTASGFHAERSNAIRWSTRYWLTPPETFSATPSSGRTCPAFTSSRVHGCHAWCPGARSPVLSLIFVEVGSLAAAFQRAVPQAPCPHIFSLRSQYFIAFERSSYFLIKLDIRLFDKQDWRDL